MTPETILESAYEQAQKGNIPDVPPEIEGLISLILQHAESQKAVLGVVVTSAAYKAYQPGQDIRYHQEQLPDGYSGRTFDTKYTTPFLKKHFPHFAMAESAWLTRSLEQPHPYTRDYPGKIRNILLKNAFLSLLEALEEGAIPPADLLIHLFSGLLQFKEKSLRFSSENLTPRQIPITRIVAAIQQHFEYRYASHGTARLPVIAIYAAYTLLMSDIKRYEHKLLLPLESHTSADDKSEMPGDINIIDEDRNFYEAIEIKHMKPVDLKMIYNALDKIATLPLERYYILTTATPNYVPALEDDLLKFIEEIRLKHGCQIIINGVIPSLKYYLRLVNQPEQFLKIYTEQLQNDYDRASAVKEQHLLIWQQLTKDYFA